MHEKTRAVFLDRDGVINYENEVYSNWNKFKFIEGSVDGIKKINKTGLKVFVITNQSSVAHGKSALKEIENLNKKMISAVAKNGGKIDGSYFCPHKAGLKNGNKKYISECNCRKPKTGMIEKAAKEHGITIKGSFIVGDKITDIKCGDNVRKKYGKFTTILVKTGYAGKDGEYGAKPDYVCENLLEAAKLIENIMFKKRNISH